MLLPPLTTAVAGTSSPPVGGVVPDGQSDFLLAYEETAPALEVNPLVMPEFAIAAPEMVDDMIAEPPPSGAGMMHGDEPGLAIAPESLIIAADPGLKPIQTVSLVDSPLPPVKMASHLLVQMMFDAPQTLPTPSVQSVGAGHAAPVPVMPPLDVLPASPAIDIARPILPDATAEPALRNTGVVKDGLPTATVHNVILSVMPTNTAPTVAAVAPDAPLPVVAVPAPTQHPVGIEQATPLPTAAAVVKQSELVVPVINGPDSKTGATAGGDLSDTLSGLSPEMTTLGGTTRSSDHQSAPAVARDVAQQLAVAVTQTAGQPTEIALNPEELGRVRMSMSLTDGTLILQINAERPETTDLLRRHIDTLAQEFRSLGYTEISFDFGEERTPQQNAHKAEALGDVADGPADTHEPAALVPRPSRGGLDLRL